MLSAAETSATPDLRVLLERFDGMYRSSGTAARVEIEIIRPQRTRTLRLRTWSRGTEQALIVIDAPARDAGTATLKVGRNLWNYLPKIARTIRVPPSMMKGSWMGSDFSNDDLVRESSYLDDYTSELVGGVATPPAWIVRLNARPGVPGLWERIELLFEEGEELPSQASFFDRKGRLSRTMYLREVREMNGRLIPTHISIVPEREAGRRTEMKYLHAEFDLDLDESMFSLGHLERLR